LALQVQVAVYWLVAAIFLFLNQLQKQREYKVSYFSNALWDYAVFLVIPLVFVPISPSRRPEQQPYHKQHEEDDDENEKDFPWKVFPSTEGPKVKQHKHDDDANRQHKQSSSNAEPSRRPRPIPAVTSTASRPRFGTPLLDLFEPLFIQIILAVHFHKDAKLTKSPMHGFFKTWR
jgi:hypothetical protein